jgi:hypothetical protein
LVSRGLVATILNDPDNIESEMAVRSDVSCVVEVFEEKVCSSKVVYNLGLASCEASKAASRQEATSDEGIPAECDHDRSLKDETRSALRI